MTPEPQARSPPQTTHTSSEAQLNPHGKNRVLLFRYTPKQYESLASQFNAYVTISVFAVAAIVSIVSFVRDTIDPKEGDLSAAVYRFEVGKFLCMVVIGLHFGIIIVGCRAWALCFRLAADCDETLEHDLEAANGGAPKKNITSDYTWDHIDQYRQVPFRRYIAYCERVQLIGTLLLLISMLLMQFSLFSEKILSWIFLVVPVALTLSIYLTGFWKISITKENIGSLRKVWQWFHGPTANGDISPDS